MSEPIQMLIVAVSAFLASSGSFWVYLIRKYKHRDAVEELIMGLAHDKIVQLGICYIEKGFVTKDEYDDLIKYFWDPYSALGGDGSAERIVNIVKLLPLKPERRIFREEHKAVDNLPKGTETVIKRVIEGDDTFERHDR